MQAVAHMLCWQLKTDARGHAECHIHAARDDKRHAGLCKLRCKRGYKREGLNVLDNPGPVPNKGGQRQRQGRKLRNRTTAQNNESHIACTAQHSTAQEYTKPLQGATRFTNLSAGEFGDTVVSLVAPKYTFHGPSGVGTGRGQQPWQLSSTNMESRGPVDRSRTNAKLQWRGWGSGRSRGQGHIGSNCRKEWLVVLRSAEGESH
jgi:hypothetical protein